MVSYFYNWYKNQHIFSQPRFSVYDNLSCFVVAENLCVLAHSKILSFKAIVACLRSVSVPVGLITNIDRTRESGGKRAKFFPELNIRPN